MGDRCVKIGLGILSSSQAMIADAINYYSDVLIVAAICGGTILATKEPDKKHPYGYGRIEYVGELLIALFIIYNGLMAMKGNIVKMLHPVEPHYTAAGIAILTITVIAILAAILYVATGINLDAYIGLLIGFLVTKAGATMLFKTISNILGNEHTFKEANEIKKTIASFDAVYDLNNEDRHNQFRRIEREVFERYPDYKIQIQMDLNLVQM